MKQAITLTDNAASRIKDIMSKDENKSLGGFHHHGVVQQSIQLN